MHLEELDLHVPASLIAQHPAEPRDAARLLHLDRRDVRTTHRMFRDLPDLLQPKDVLVLNDSRVLAARVFARKPTGGRVELLFIRPVGPGGSNPPGDGAGSSQGGDVRHGRVWEVLARPSARLRPGMRLEGESAKFGLELLRPLGAGRWVLGVDGDEPVEELLARHGTLPLPPYITAPLGRPDDYQTVYSRVPGSAAAPTAGLHFTEELLEGLRLRGVRLVTVTLHVGLDTFRPIQAPRVEEHEIHREAYSVTEPALATLNAARRDGSRLVAVGTTSVRVLETLYSGAEPGGSATGAATGWASLYIVPGYRFRAVDALITNFHLPRTTLLALVMAFAGVEPVRRAYAEAVAEEYRFFSFGDAMFIE